MSIKYYATEEYVDAAIANNSVDGAVLYTEQELTAEQRAQARANIGAITENDLKIKKLPVLRRETWAAGIGPDMYITYVSIADMEPYVPYATDYYSDGRQNNYQFVIVCDDGTEATVKFIATHDLVYTSGVGGGATLLYFENDTYTATYDDLSTASNVTVTAKSHTTYLTVYNTDEYIPTRDYHPATKKYVDDAVAVCDALANHTHDDKYYTEAEVDALIASVANNEVFVITVTKGEDGKYSADKTYDEIYNAYINKKELSLRYNDGEYDGIYPLNVYDGDSLFPGFAFEYHSVNGTRVFRRKFTISATAVSFNEVEFSQNRIATVNTNSTLTTTDKTLVGAINEINEKASNTESVGTIASGENQHVQGRYNIENPDYAHIVGNGESDDNRSNAHTLDWDGNAWYQGDIFVGGTSQDDGIRLVKISEYITDAEIDELMAQVH